MTEKDDRVKGKADGEKGKHAGVFGGRHGALRGLQFPRQCGRVGITNRDVVFWLWAHKVFHDGCRACTPEPWFSPWKWSGRNGCTSYLEEWNGALQEKFEPCKQWRWV